MRFTSLLLPLLLLAACPTSPGEEGDRCSEHGDCDDDLVCVDDECADPYGRTWRLTIVRATISPHDSTGDAWDSGGTGAPDPFVIVEVDGAEVLRTTAQQDTFDATFNVSVSFRLTRSTNVAISLWDEDVLFNTPIVTTGSQDVDEDELRAGQIPYAAQTGSSPDGGSAAQEVTQLVVKWEVD